MNYDLMVSDAKRAATNAVIELAKDKPHPEAPHHMAYALDELNKAWDKLTDALVRQREERDRQIVHLLDELAEARRR